jgi:hypothetical protein
MGITKKFGKEIARWRIEDDDRTWVISYRHSRRILYSEQVEPGVWTPWEFRWRLLPANALVQSAQSKSDEQRILDILNVRYPNASITRC